MKRLWKYDIQQSAKSHRLQAI